MRFGGYVSRALHDFDFLGALEDAHFMKNRSRIDDSLRWFQRLAIRFAHQRQLANDFVIEIGAAVAKCVIKNSRTVQNFGKLLVEL